MRLICRELSGHSAEVFLTRAACRPTSALATSKPGRAGGTAGQKHRLFADKWDWPGIPGRLGEEPQQQ
jgi:hypothetical protein